MWGNRLSQDSAEALPVPSAQRGVGEYPTEVVAKLLLVLSTLVRLTGCPA
jgi:hypothetical protein